MKVTLDVDEGVLVFDAAKTVAIWALPDLPELYRKQLEPLPLPERTLVALVPKGYTRDLQHITENPYFAEQNLYSIEMSDGSCLYVGC